MEPLTKKLLALTEQPYDSYNAILPEIKANLDDDQRDAFERVLGQELPLTTARRAYRTAVKVALGEPAAREWRPAEMLAERFRKR